MNIPKLRHVVNVARMSASPLPNGCVFWLADRTQCPYCEHVLRCDPEPLADGASFALDCPGCFKTIVRVE
jgi:hypothetical protein